MDEMTMGQRIAMQRKLQNLSQEALAEKMEVSRQAISKWESDGAVPEVDKLIALGRIFGVSVGWLLGTEKDSTTSGEPGFTDGQMQIIEALLAENVKPAPAKRSRAGWVMAGLLCLVLVGMCWWFTGWMTRQETRVSAMTGQLDQMREQITQLDAAVAENSGKVKLLTSHSLTYTATEDSWNSVTVTLTCIPKVYRETEEAWFAAKNSGFAGGEEKVLCEWNGEAYTATLTLIPGGDYHYYFRQVGAHTFQEEDLSGPDVIRNLVLNEQFHLDENSEKALQLRYEGHGWLDTELKIYEYNEGIYTPRIFPENGRGYNKIELVLRLNDEIIWSKSCLEEFLIHCGGDEISMKPFYPEISVELPALKFGNKLDLRLEWEFSNGRQYAVRLDERYAWERPA